MEETLKQQFRRALINIKGDIIAEQRNPDLIAKWCVPLNCVSIFNFTKENYIRYYTLPFKKYPRLEKEIEKAAIDKVTNGLTDQVEFINMIIDGANYYYQANKSGLDIILRNEKADILKAFGYTWIEKSKKIKRYVI